MLSADAVVGIVSLVLMVGLGIITIWVTARRSAEEGRSFDPLLKIRLS